MSGSVLLQPLAQGLAFGDGLHGLVVVEAEQLEVGVDSWLTTFVFHQLGQTLQIRLGVTTQMSQCFHPKSHVQATGAIVDHAFWKTTISRFSSRGGQLLKLINTSKMSKRSEKKTKEAQLNQYELIEGCQQSPSPWSPAPIQLQTSETLQFDPPAVVPGQKGIDGLDCYHGLLPREDVNAMLIKDGDFLVRNTELFQGTAIREMCISVKVDGNILHFPLKANKAGLYNFDDQPKFPTILELINHYYTNCIPFTKNKVILLSPVARNEWELLHCHVKLVRKIGEGAFGAVFAGIIHSVVPPKLVAVKTMKYTFQTKWKIEEFMKEARLMRKLNHPNIVHCFGVAAEIEPLYIVFEFIDGGGLDSYLKQRTVDVLLAERLQMVWHATLALEYVHSKGIIHCDIACRNCLYGDGELKLSDFGISRKTELHQLEKNDLTPVRWTAPEVFNFRCLTPASDVWATGVLAWEIFNNAKEPYEGMTGQQVRDQVSKGQFRLLRLPDWAPKEMDTLLDGIFAFDPKIRLRMGEIAEKMEKICQMYPSAVTPASRNSSKNGKQQSSSASSSKSRVSRRPKTVTVGSKKDSKSRNTKSHTEKGKRN